MTTCQLLIGDALETLRTLPDCSVQCCVTSPPYFGLRDYGVAGQIGLEDTPEAYTARLVDVFREVRRVLRNDGTLWMNVGDSFSSGGRDSYDPALYSKTTGIRNAAATVGKARPAMSVGIKPKDLLGIPWMLAFALRADGWYLRSDIIWAKPAPMPESVTDRPTRSHEYLFLLSKRERYFYDAAAIAEPVVKGASGSTFTAGKTGINGMGRVSLADRDDGATRNKRDVWTIASASYPGSHYAVMPAKLVEPCILAGSREGDTVLDPFFGTGTTGMVALSHARAFVGIDLDPRNVDLARQRIGPMLLDVPAATTQAAHVVDKQAATGSRLYTGFNARWDAKEAVS